MSLLPVWIEQKAAQSGCFSHQGEGEGERGRERVKEALAGPPKGSAGHVITLSPTVHAPGGLLICWASLLHNVLEQDHNIRFSPWPRSELHLSYLQPAHPSGHSWTPRLDPWVGKILWRRKWQLTPVSLPGEPHGPRSLVGCSPWGCKESYTHTHTSHLPFTLSFDYSDHSVR